MLTLPLGLLRRTQKHDRTLSGILNKRALGGPTEGGSHAEEHGLDAGGELTRFFSTPQPYIQARRAVKAPQLPLPAVDAPALPPRTAVR